MSTASANRGCGVPAPLGPFPCDHGGMDDPPRPTKLGFGERRKNSTKRAGEWSRAVALRRQYAYARRMWKVLVSLAVVPSLALPFLFFVPQWARWFIGGAMAATSVALVLSWILLGSGTAPRIMGAWGEEWTADELKAFSRRGWQVVHRAILARDDIDHVAIGPPGVVVVETKWRGDSWTSEDRDGRIAAARVQVLTNAKRVRGYRGTGKRVLCAAMTCEAGACCRWSSPSCLFLYG